MGKIFKGNLFDPRYQRRIISAYSRKKKSNLAFWHTELSPNDFPMDGSMGRYYMDFRAKTKYPGPFDESGIPMLNYGGNLGVQYNPNAIAQFALGLHDLYLDTGDKRCLNEFLKFSDWFVENIRMIDSEVGLWEYKFDFEYHHYLKAPWRSALAQGQGISVLVRANAITQDSAYIEVAKKAFASFERDIFQPGGVVYVDETGDIWLEECVTPPPTHVLNGFIWSLWGVLDFYLATGYEASNKLYECSVRTLEKNISKYHLGIWSRYHLAPTLLPMISSPYYHRLHIVQLRIMERLTGISKFGYYADLWERCMNKRRNRSIALAWKSLFKLIYY